MHLSNRVALILLGLFILGFGGQTVMADTVAFFGTRAEYLPAPLTQGSCITGMELHQEQTDGYSIGTSNFGSFETFGSACLNFPFPLVIHDGVFTFVFEDGDTLSGTWSGTSSRVISPAGRVLTTSDSYVVTGGTGKFDGAIGSFSDSGGGTSTGVTATQYYTFEGTISAPGLVAVPEPGTVGLLSTGAIGMMLKFRRRTKRAEV
jgi:PEP-CTERM motif